MAALACAGAAIAVLALVIVTKAGGQTFVTAFADWGFAATVGVTSCASLLAAVRHRGRVRAGWSCIAASMALVCVAQLIFSWYENIAQVIAPFPGIADALFLSGEASFVAGLFAFPSGSRRATTLARSALDGLIIGMALLAVSWPTFLEAVYQSVVGASSLVQVVGLAYPISSLMVATMALTLAMRTASGMRVPMFLLSGGILMITIGNGMFAYATAHLTYQTGSVIDIMWWGGFLAVALAAVRAFVRPFAGAVRTEEVADRRRFLPYLPVTIALALAVRTELTSNTLPRPFFVILVMLIVLVVVRQFTALGDNLKLLNEVHLRESELEETVTQLSRSELQLRGAEADRDHLLSQTFDAAEQERTQVALDLHDGPIQSLTAAAFTLDRLARRLTTEAPACVSLAGDSRAALAVEISSLRQTMYGLRPPVLDQSGLEGAIRDWTKSFEERFGITCDVATDLHGTPLETPVATALYRIAQEAMANIQKHSGTSTVYIVLTSTDASYRMHIKDAGRGFDVDRIGGFIASDHFGLAGMRQRATMIGATLTITSKPNEGTAIDVVVPLQSSIDNGITIHGEESTQYAESAHR